MSRGRTGRNPLEYVVGLEGLSILRVQLADEVIELRYHLPIHVDNLSSMSVSGSIVSDGYRG